MHPTLTFEELRVLGCLLEKEMTTPDYYPLTPAALVAACNQSSNREPVVAWDQACVEAAAAGLRRKSLAAMVHLAGSRVPKFKHLLDQYLPTLARAELALLAVLLLRGPQTAAELRARAERMHDFGGADEVEQALARLAGHGEGPLVAHLPPGGGRRASTYAHLLGGEVTPAAATAPTASIIPPPPDVAAELEKHLAAVESELASLQRRLGWLEQSLGTRAPDPGEPAPGS